MITVTLADGRKKKVPVAKIKTVYQASNGSFKLETTGGDKGETSKNGFRKIVRKRPEAVGEPEPRNALLRWLASS